MTRRTLSGILATDSHMNKTLLLSISTGASPISDTSAVRNIPGSGRMFCLRLQTSDSTDSSVAGLLRTFRRRLGIDRHEASRRLGVSYYSILSWEQKTRFPKEDISRRLSDGYHLNYFELEKFRRVWRIEKKERKEFLSRILSVSMSRLPRRRRSSTTADEKREDTRLRVQRLRDRRFLEKSGLFEGGGLNDRGRTLAEKARANYPDRSLDARTAKVLLRFLSNEPRKQYGRRHGS